MFEEQNPGIRDKPEAEIETAFKKYCKHTKGDDERFVRKIYFTFL